jgi:hypothetical protein
MHPYCTAFFIFTCLLNPFIGLGNATVEYTTYYINKALNLDAQYEDSATIRNNSIDIVNPVHYPVSEIFMVLDLSVAISQDDYNDYDYYAEQTEKISLCEVMINGTIISLSCLQ